MYKSKALLPKEVKHQSLCMAAEVLACRSEAEEKDLLELDRLKAVANLDKYQEETRSWRDTKVKLRELDIGDLVLLRSPRIESFRKLELKWVGPYVITEKPRLGHIASRMVKEESWSIPGTWKTSIVLSFNM
jgi:hypothetical protein